MTVTTAQQEALAASHAAVEAAIVASDAEAAANAAIAAELASRVVGYMTPDEFFAFEKDGYERHELWDGKVVTMAGGTPNHNYIGLSTARAFADALDAAKIDRRVYSSDQMVCSADNKRYYPDVTVAAEEPPHFDDKYALLKPLIIVEVLSPSTALFDTNGKFAQYRTIESLRHYVLVEQDRVGVTHYEKIAGNLWAIVGTYQKLSDVLVLGVDSTHITVPLQKIYARITFPAADDDTAA